MNGEKWMKIRPFSFARFYVCPFKWPVWMSTNFYLILTLGKEHSHTGTSPFTLKCYWAKRTERIWLKMRKFIQGWQYKFHIVVILVSMCFHGDIIFHMKWSLFNLLSYKQVLLSWVEHRHTELKIKIEYKNFNK